MSLQTPRLLTPADEVLLRRLAGAPDAKVAPTPATGAFTLTHAVRLVRKDIDRLTPIHQKQFNRMMAPSWTLERAAALIGTGTDDEGDDGGGLVYLRIEAQSDARRAFEVWIHDDARYPSTAVSADGVCAFVGGTVDAIGLEMSQSCWDAPTTPDAEVVLAFLKPELPRVKVTVKGPAMTADPPFALARAPKPVLKVAARRLTEAEARALPADARFQLLHSLRAAIATDDPADMEDAMQLGMVYWFVDPGPDEKAFGFKEGLIYLAVKTTERSSREFEGWFYDGRIETAESYWPSPKATVTSGRFFEPGTIRFTGVEIKSSQSIEGGKVAVKPKVTVDVKHGLPVANALAAGLKKLGLSFDVQVTREPKPGEKTYFGSIEHARAVEQQRRGVAAWDQEKQKRKKGAKSEEG